MINDVIRRLQKASTRPNDFSSRYSELLDRLWQRKDSESQAESRAKTPNGAMPNSAHGNTAGGQSRATPNLSNGANGVLNDPIGTPTTGARPQDTNANSMQAPNQNFLIPQTPFRAPSSLPGSAWQQGLQDEFSWLDLQAVGELVSGHGDLNGNVMSWGGAASMMDGAGFGYGYGFGGNGWGTNDGWGGEWGETEDGGGKFF
jgi:hypothetical protein